VQVTDYRIARQNQDGSWSLQVFQAEDDPDAISLAKSMRRDQRCELFRDYFWLASFDGLVENDDISEPHTNENTSRHHDTLETEVAYFRRRALEEREWARISKTTAAKLAHLQMAGNLEGLAWAVGAERQRLSLYLVNQSPPSDACIDEQYPLFVGNY
jgi:hypothetical protein